MIKKYQYLWDVIEEVIAQVVVADDEIFVVGRVIDRREGISTSYEILSAYSQEDLKEYFEKRTLEQVETFFNELYKNCDCEEE
jgi:hypothetical protein